MYADERELLVFRTFLQSVSVPKRFFDTLQNGLLSSPFCYSSLI